MSSKDNWKFVQVALWFIVVWFCWGFFSFFPFHLLPSGAVGGTGLMLCVVILVCARWIVMEIRALRSEEETNTSSLPKNEETEEKDAESL